MALNNIKINNTTNVKTGVVYDISKATGQSYETLSDALSGNNVPPEVREGGMTVRFVSNSDNKYVQYRLASSIWSTDIHDWTSEDPYFVDKIMQKVNEAIDENTPIEIHGDVTNAPDEEDLTSINQGGTDVLKFKDKAYNPLTYSGMGRIILRKNIVSGVNTLTQSIINQANTIYVIQYDFTLGEDITIPENCVLEFDGGSVFGEHTITGQNTGIQAGLIKIFNTNVILVGSWHVDEVYSEWFGAKADGKTDCTDIFEKAVSLLDLTNGGIIKLLSGIYLNKGITTGIKTNIVGSGNGATIIKTIGEGNNGITIPYTSRCARLENFTLKGSRNAIGDSVGHGIQVDDPTQAEDYSEYQNYMYDRVANPVTHIPAYSWLRVNNVNVYYYNKGLNIEFLNADAKILNSTFAFCIDGVRFRCTDSLISNCYMNNNLCMGLYIDGSNNKIEKCKIIFNGQGNPDGAAVNIWASRNTIIGCETQDNYCSAYYFAQGSDNTMIGCITNTDGYKPEGTYRDSYHAKTPIILNVPNNRVNFTGNLITFYRNEDGVAYEPIRTTNGRLPKGVKMLCDNDQYTHWQERPSVLKYFSNIKVNGSYSINTINDHSYLTSTNVEDIQNIKLPYKIEGDFAIVFDFIIPDSISGGTLNTILKLSNNMEFYTAFWPTTTLGILKYGSQRLEYNFKGKENKNVERRLAIIRKDGKLGVYGILKGSKTNEQNNIIAFITKFADMDVTTFTSFDTVYFGDCTIGVRHLLITRDTDILDNLLYLVPSYDITELYNSAIAAFDAETYNASDFA